MENIDKTVEREKTEAKQSVDGGVVAAADKERKRTVGNIIYDFPVFGGVAWFGVALLSALSAHEARYGVSKYFTWLRSLNKAVYSGVRSSLGKTILKNASEETLHGYASGTTMFVTLGMGGNALAAPIKWMEDNRQKNAARIDNLLGTTPPDPELIENEPEQTWGSVVKGRLISWGLSYLAFIVMGPKLVGVMNDSCTKFVTDIWTKNLFPKHSAETVRRWADIAAFDFLFTAITATTTYLFSRYFAKKEGRQLSAADELFEINTVDPKAFTRKFSHQAPQVDEKEKDSGIKKDSGVSDSNDKSENKQSAFASKIEQRSKTAVAPVSFVERAVSNNNADIAVAMA